MLEGGLLHADTGSVLLTASSRVVEQEFLTLLRLNGVAVPPFGLPNGRIDGKVKGYLHAVHCVASNRVYQGQGLASGVVIEQSTIAGCTPAAPGREAEVGSKQLMEMVQAVESLIRDIGEDPTRPVRAALSGIGSPSAGCGKCNCH
jgi:hypothetical protein